MTRPAQPEDEEAARLASQLVRRLRAISTDELRSRAAGAFLESLVSATAVLVCGSLAREARDSPDAASAVSAIARSLARGHLDAERVAGWLSLARSRADRLVEALFASGPATRTYDVADEPFVDRRLARLPAGVKRTLSRGRDPDLLIRLAREQDARVIGELLANPRCTEREALVVAGKRPTHASVLETVLASRHGSSRRIRRAIAHNPYASVALAVRAMQGLSTVELGDIAADERLSGEVRRHAASLHQGRKATALERDLAAAPAPSDAEVHRLIEKLLPAAGDEEDGLVFVGPDGREHR